MKRKPLYTVILAALLATGAGVASGQDQDRERQQAQKQSQTRAQEPIYGSQLMTAEERNEYRNRMRAAKTFEEREQIRKEHHERMKARAKERGITLPDEPPPRGAGRGMGPGGGMGPAMGPGGAGPGRGR